MRVIIVGAGPAGLILTLLLAKQGIEVRLLEKESSPSNETRATIYQAVSLYEFERAGILDDVNRAALHPSGAAMRDLAGRRLRSLPLAESIAISIAQLSQIMQTHLATTSAPPIAWDHEVVDVGEDTDSAWVDVKTPTGQERLKADYVVGCDGGQSFVRRKLFGANALKGFTWERSVTTCDFVHHFPDSVDLDDSNLFLDPQNAFVLFRTSKKPSEWRTVFQQPSQCPDYPELTAVLQRLEQMLPGQQRLDQDAIRDVTTYHIHQRVVDSMVSGRIVLASDAAHLCCPYGALGLNGGIADIGSLSDCLVAIQNGKADRSILQTYSDVRRDKWKTIIDPQSQGVLKMIYNDPERLKAGPSPSKNGEGQQARLVPNSMALRYDFSQHFTNQ